MQNTITPQWIPKLNTGLQKVGLELSTSSTETCQFPIAFNFVTKADGNLWWLWPAGTHTAPFLNFYNQDGLRAKTVAIIAKSVSMFGQAAFLANGHHLLSVGPLSVYYYINHSLSTHLQIYADIISKSEKTNSRLCLTTAAKHITFAFSNNQKHHANIDLYSTAYLERNSICAKQYHYRYG